MNISANNSDSIRLPEETAKLFNSFGTEKQYPKNTPLYFQGEQAECFYYLKKGRVKSFIHSENGSEKVLNVYQEGSLFGEASFFDELPRVSSAIALSPCEIVPIDRELVYAEIRNNPELAMAMLKYLARTVRLLSSHVDDMAFRPADWRVARYLLSLPTAADQSLACTQDEIADSISTSRITVSRVLRDFVKKGWITTGYRSIQILNRAELHAFCQT